MDAPIFTGDFHRVVTDYERQILHRQWVVERYDVCKVAQHEPHTYREGFFWHRKVHCPGVPIKRERHRHSFKLTRLLTLWDFWSPVGKDFVAWQCECKAYLMADRIVLQEEMIPNRRKVEQVWPG